MSMGHLQSSRPVRHVLLGVCALLAVRSAGATDRFYADRSVESTNGRYYLDARSPDNAGTTRKPFAGHFRYTLRDTKADRILWEREQPSSELSPIGTFVHDEAWVVIRTSGDQLVVLAPVTGEKVLELRILEQFPKEEQDLFVERWTVGPIWSPYARWSFLRHDDRVHFVLRTAWDRRVIVDLTTGVLVTEPDTALIAACDDDDRRFAIATLDGAPDRLAQADPKDYTVLNQVRTAVHIAGRMKIQETVPSLRKLNPRSGKVNRLGDVYLPPLGDSTLSLLAHIALQEIQGKPLEQRRRPAWQR